ncbi:MAG TPA: hypothetical protein VEI97_16905 [bacterium]|nr:hypothetical protein [bacterium]
MSPFGIALSYWVLAMSLGIMGGTFLFLASENLVRGRGDLPAVVFALFFGLGGLGLLFISLNGFWDFANGYTDTLDVLVRGWAQLARVCHRSFTALW